MKQIIKKIITSFALMMSLFAFTACNEEDNSIDQQFAFEKYKTAQSNLNNPNKGYNSISTLKTSSFGYTKTQTIKSTVNFLNGEAAYISKDNQGNVTEEYYVVNDGEKNIFYHHIIEEIFGEPEESYSASYVGKDFILHYNGEDSSVVPNANLDSFEDFKTSFIEMFSNVMQEDMGTGASASIKVEKFSFSKDKENYKLNIKLKANVLSASFSMEVIIKFSDEFVNSITMNINMGLATISNTTKFYSGYDSDMMPSSFANYTNGEDIENADFTVTYYMDGVVSGWLNFYQDSYKPGEAFAFDPEELDYISIDNTTIDGWYLDSKYTKKIDSLREYPSYDIELYAKTIPNEGYAVIVYTANIKEEGNLLWFPDSDTTVYSINETTTVDFSNLVGEEATITSIEVNGSKLEGTLLNIIDRGYYIVTINGTTPNA